MWFQQLIGVTYGDAFQFRKIADLQVDHEGNIWAMATTVRMVFMMLPFGFAALRSAVPS